ncbi:MAG: sigma-E factor negative regulatory protein [Noviherbaspirillum sp.]
MNTKEISREQISAFADGELADQHVEIVLAALRQEEGRADWETYHQIGDVLRSDDMAVTLSSSFAARMAARLEAEPATLASQAPASPIPSIEQSAMASGAYKRTAKRWAMPSMVAAAAVATVAFFTTPQLMVALKGEATSGGAIALASSPNADGVSLVAASAPEGVVLRDPRIDDYLLAHQRFSPSVYSTAQYARSATFSSK